MGVCLPNTVHSSVKHVIHEGEVCNQVLSNLTVLNNRDIGMTNNSLLQSDNENLLLNLP